MYLCVVQYFSHVQSNELNKIKGGMSWRRLTTNYSRRSKIMESRVDAQLRDIFPKKNNILYHAILRLDFQSSGDVSIVWTQKQEKILANNIPLTHSFNLSKCVCVHLLFFIGIYGYEIDIIIALFVCSINKTLKKL